MEYMSTEIRSAREAMTIFNILGIKEITTERQRKNGTHVYELPIHLMYGPENKFPLRFATYKSGYVRNVTECNSSSYQINKTKTQPAGTNGYHFEHVERILIPNYDERLVYLANFILRNYYQKPTYLMNDYTVGCLKEAYYEQNKTGLPWGDSVHPDSTPENDIQVIINGHRYNLS